MENQIKKMTKQTNSRRDVNQIDSESITGQTIHYPRKGVKFKEVMNQETFDRLTSLIFEWQQGPGNFGALILHACWGETSTLARRYQGQTVAVYYDFMWGIQRLFQHTGNIRWKRLAYDIASNLLFLQNKDGGFRHAVFEFEPRYDSVPTPIHQGFALLTLLDYAGWEHADPVLKNMIRPALDRHWEWFNKNFWMVGNGGQRPLRGGAGWCGVTNQDLFIVAALSAYGRLYGDFSRYNEWGKKALDVYLSPLYYYESLGLFERGDSKDFNFVERTSYHGLILQMLERIINDLGSSMEDKRLRTVIDNVTAHLFDAAFVGPDGLTHLAWGAKTDPADKSTVLEWIKSPAVFAEYTRLIPYMEKWSARRQDKEKQSVVESLKATFAAYVFSDGSIPISLWTTDPIISIVSATTAHQLLFWKMLIELLGDGLRDPAQTPVRCYHRSIGELTWKSRGSLWAIEKAGARVFGGYKPLSHGITHGPEEKPAFGSYSELDNCDIHEILDVNQ